MKPEDNPDLSPADRPLGPGVGASTARRDPAARSGRGEGGGMKRVALDCLAVRAGGADCRSGDGQLKPAAEPGG